MIPVIQEEKTGCGIASVATILGQSYDEVKKIASSLGISAADESLWSNTQYVRKILLEQGVNTSVKEHPFVSWNKLPDLALLSIKHYEENGKNFWHWVVFNRSNDVSVILDSASYLSSNIRTDFDAIKPKWFIEVYKRS